MKDTALLIIDMQSDFASEGSPYMVKGAPAFLPNMRKVLDVFRTKGAPIFHILRIHRKDGSDVEIMRREKFAARPFAVEGSEGARVVEALEPHEGEYIIKKTRMSAFLFTDLDSMLRSIGVKKVVIIGIQTPNCIRATAYDAVAYNYPTYLVYDAVAAASMDVHDANVADMRNAGVTVINTGDVEGLL